MFQWGCPGLEPMLLRCMSMKSPCYYYYHPREELSKSNIMPHNTSAIVFLIICNEAE